MHPPRGGGRDGQVFLQIPQHPEEGAPAAPATPAAPEKASLAENEFFLKDVQPGNMKLLKLNGQRVLAYNIDGTYFATAEECTHVGGPLSEGELNGNEVICPWHGSCFRVTDGQATCPPARSPLQTYRVQIEGEIGRVQA